MASNGMINNLKYFLLISSSLFPISASNRPVIDQENEINITARKGRLFFPLYLQNMKSSNGFYGDPAVQDNEPFDFIVVGSGPSGLVLANRLSEVQEWRVLLLEDGDEAHPLADVPFLGGFFQFTDYTWGYTAERQNGSCLGCPEYRMRSPHGRALGSSTVTDHMIYSRGHPIDYDRWSGMGNQGWSYDEVLPYFKKSEDAHLDRFDAGYHQNGGYLAVSDVPYRTEAARAFVRAAEEAGYPYVDYNGKKQIGVSYVQVTGREGKRVSAEKAFLRPIRSRPNLKILKKSKTTKVLINKEDMRVYGVEYIRNRRYHVALAEKEVILSAGSFISPQLLMLSGIGPKRHLKKLDIPILQESPVGRKMYDHILFPGLNFILNESIVIDQEEALSDLENFVRIENGQGVFSTVMGGLEALAFLKTNVSNDSESSLPDIELLLFSGGISNDKGLIFKKMFSISDEIYERIWRPLENKNVLQIFPILLHPKSVGHLKLKSKNPFHWPKFFMHFLSDEGDQDIRTLLSGIREAQKIIESPSLRRYGATLVRTPIPRCAPLEFDSDDYWACAIRHLSATLGDQSSTCKMGPNNDPEAVVDPRLRVYGTTNLRVADASVFPAPIAAHNAGPAYMIGEKAADMIKEEHKNELLSRKDIR